MREELIDTPGTDEPEDGWVTARPLVDSEVVEIVLCRFTGRQVRVEQSACPDRAQHPDVECRAVYLQADHLPFLTSAAAGGWESAQDEIRQPWRGGDWSGVSA